MEDMKSMVEQNAPGGPQRKILLATDLSARCDRALDRAAALATAWQAELIAVHALEQADDFYAGELERRLPSWRRLPDSALLAAAQLRGDMLQAGPDVVAVVEKGEPAELVLGVAKARGCDLIVTGIARDETLGRFGLGTTVDRLLRRSQVPLLVVRKRARSPYGNVVVATDLSECSRGALRVALAFFPDRQLGILHAYDPAAARLTGDSARLEEEYRAAAAAACLAFLDETGIPVADRGRFKLLLEHGRPIEIIHQYVRDRSIDLVVIGTRGRSALFEMFIGSTAKEVLSSLPCDVLVVPEPRSVTEGDGPRAG
jgi:nucleotide-binding universal stress UspA family protein